MINKKFVISYDELTDLFSEDMYDNILQYVTSDDGSCYMIITTDLSEWEDSDIMKVIIKYLIKNGVPENEEVYILR